MSVSPFFEREWDDLRRRAERAAGYLGEQAPERAEEFRNEADEFGRKPTPRNHSEFLDLVAEAAELATGWRERCGEAPRLVREYADVEAASR